MVFLHREAGKKTQKSYFSSFFPSPQPCWLVGQIEHGALFCILKVREQFPIVFPSNKGVLGTKQSKCLPAGLLEQLAPAPLTSCPPASMKEQGQKGTVSPTANEVRDCFQLLLNHLLYSVKIIENYSRKVNGSKMARLIENWVQRKHHPAWQGISVVSSMLKCSHFHHQEVENEYFLSCKKLLKNKIARSISCTASFHLNYFLCAGIKN